MSENNFNYKTLSPFKWFVLENFPFIEADFDALTNWQLFCKLGKEMNKIINNVNSIGNQTQELTDFVSNYFDNLDVQDEINNKLDAMVLSGELQNILMNYTDVNKVYSTTTSMISDSTIENGQKIKTLGYYNANDGGGAEFYVTNSSNANVLQIPLSNGLYANMLFKNTIKTSQYGIKGDNLTDNYTKLNALFTFLNNYAPYLEIVFDGANVIKFSDLLVGTFSNKKIILETDLQLTKTVNLSRENPLRAIDITGTVESYIENIIIEGNNHYIDGNGSNVTQNNSTTSGLYSAHTLGLQYIRNLRVNNLIVRNGYKDCMTVTSCDGAIVNGCQFIGSYRDNGLLVSSTDITKPKPVIIQNCYAKGCRDLGFSTWYGKNIKFINCKAEECGNTGATIYDDTYVSMGGGFSIEVPSNSTSEVNKYFNTTIENCEAYNCYNYGIYSNVGNCIIRNCKIHGILAGGNDGYRRGNPIIIEEITYPVIIENIVIDCDELYSALNLKSLSTANTLLKLDNILIKAGTYSLYGIYMGNIKESILNNIIDLSTSSGINVQGASSTNRNTYAKLDNIKTNNFINLQNNVDTYVHNIIMNYATNETNPYPIRATRGTNIFFDSINIISESEPDYAIRVGGQYQNEAITNIYEGTILTNKTNTIDSRLHS